MLTTGDIRYYRSEIARIYGIGFANSLPPRQLVAVYRNMKARGKFEKKPGGEFRQMTLEDWVEMKGEKIQWLETTQ